MGSSLEIVVWLVPLFRHSLNTIRSLLSILWAPFYRKLNSLKNKWKQAYHDWLLVQIVKISNWLQTDHKCVGAGQCRLFFRLFYHMHSRTLLYLLFNFLAVLIITWLLVMTWCTQMIQIRRHLSLHQRGHAASAKCSSAWEHQGRGVGQSSPAEEKLLHIISSEKAQKCVDHPVVCPLVHQEHPPPCHNDGPGRKVPQWVAHGVVLQTHI